MILCTWWSERGLIRGFDNCKKFADFSENEYRSRYHGMKIKYLKDIMNSQLYKLLENELNKKINVKRYE